MKKTFFDVGLYKEGLRQLRAMGLVGIVGFAGCAVVSPVSVILTNMELQKAGSDEVYTEITNLLSSNAAMLLIYMVLVPVMVLSLFRFQNRREASDLYHSFPQTRAALFFSFFAALMTYVTLTIVASAAVNLGLMALFPDYFIVDMAASLHTIFNIWAASLLVAASVALAMNLTGTTFSNVIVSGFIIFLPRTLIQILIAWIAGSLPYMDTTRMPALLDGKLNVVFGFFIELLEDSVGSEIFVSTASGIYTFCLALIYLILAALAFHHRKSECAGYAAPNRTIQAVYRLTAAMIICLLPCYGLYQILYLYRGDGIDGGSVLFIIVTYIIAVAVYFLYELITTRQLADLKRALPGLGVLVGMNVLLLVFSIGGNSMLKNKTFTADEVSAVSYLGVADDYYNYSDYEDYFEVMTEDIRLDSEEITTLIADQYTEMSRLWKDERDTYYHMAEQMEYINVAIYSGSRTYYRNVPVSTEQMQTIIREMEAAEEFRSAYMELPELADITLSASENYYFDNEETIAAVYEALREDVRNMTFEEWFAICNEEDYEEEELRVATIYANMFIDNKSCQMALRIYPSMAQATDAFLEESDWAGQQQKLVKTLKDIDPYEDLNVSLIAYPAADEDDIIRSAGLNYYTFDEEELTRDQAELLCEQLGEALADKVGEKPDFGERTVYVYLVQDKWDDATDWYEWDEYEAYFTVDIEELPEYFQSQLQAKQAVDE